MRWFVERHLRPEALEPDPEPMVRGELAHRALEHALSRAGEPTAARLVPERLPDARALVHRALRRARRATSGSRPNPERLRPALRRLEADLVRYLEHAAHAGSGFRPAHFEVSFGLAEDPHPPLELDGGALRLAGRIDRIDVGADGREALVYDYKGKTATPQAQVAGRGQAPGRRCTCWRSRHCSASSRSAASTSRSARRRRSARAARVLEDADPGLDSCAPTGARADELEALLEACAAAARAAVAQLRAGALRPRARAVRLGRGLRASHALPVR